MTAAALPPVLSSALPGAMSSAPSGASSAAGPAAAGANAGSSASKEPGAFARELNSARNDAKADRSEPRPADRSPGAPKTAHKQSPDGPPRSQAPGKPRDPQDARDSTDPAQRDLRRWLAAAQGSASDAPDGEPPTTDAPEDATRLQVEADAAAPTDANALAAALQPGTERGKPPADRDEQAATAGRVASQGFAAPSTQPVGGRLAATQPTADTRAVEGDPGAAVRGDAARGRELSAVDASHRETRSDTKPTPTPAAPAPLAAFAAELARSSQALAEPAAQAKPDADIRLPTPVHSPQFVPNLAGELVMLAREGVQEARVHLHPAELGPIAVQITLDGQAAQVRLAVDSALTRDLLEQGLPTLAAAMRENGLTLAGGGVFQQPRDPSRQGQEGSPGRPGQDAGGQAVAASDGDVGVDGSAGSARSLRLRAAGRIDVFA